MSKTIKFEEAMIKLEETVRLLESGSLTLDESIEKYEDALKNLEQSLSLFNDVRTANYPETKNDSLQLELYRDDYLNVEEAWIDETPYATVPESMSSIREQISLAYSGLADKVASDYNRNVYIELQKTIRLDRRFEARNELLKRSNSQLLLVISILIALFLTIIYVYRRISAKFKLKNKQTGEITEIPVKVDWILKR